MSEKFDPYHKWLGIPPDEQPADHYRLLGISLFESDPDVIEGAADRQMAHVQTHKLGPHAAASQQLLNKLAAAKITLLTAAKKAAYDETLRIQQAAPTRAEQASVTAAAIFGAAGRAPAAASRSTAPDVLDFVETDKIGGKSTSRKKANSPRTRPGKEKPTAKLALIGGAALVVVAGIAAALVMRGGAQPSEGREVAINTTKTAEKDGPSAIEPAANDTSASDPSKPPADDDSHAKTVADESVSKAAHAEQPAVEVAKPTAAPLKVPPNPPALAQLPPKPPIQRPVVQQPANPAPGNAPAGENAIAPVKVLLKETRNTRCVDISPDGNFVFWSGLVTVGENQLKSAYALWDVRKGGQEPLSMPESPQKAAFTSDGKQIVTATPMEATVWNLATMQSVRAMRLPQIQGGFNLSMSDDGSLVGLRQDAIHTLTVFDPQSGNQVLQAANLPDGFISVCLSPGGNYVFINGAVMEEKDGRKQAAGWFGKLYDLKAKREQPIKPATKYFAAANAAFSANGILAIGSPSTPQIDLWNIAQGVVQATIPLGNKGSLHCMAFTPDGQRLLGGLTGGKLLMWNVGTGELLAENAGHRNAALDLQISGDGRMAVSAENQGPVLLWQLSGAKGSRLPALAPAPATAAASVPAAAKSAPPDDAARKTALKLIKDVFGADYTKAKKPTEKVALAEKLQGQAAQSQDPAEKYVLLTEARDLSCDAGDAAVFFKSLDALGANYSVDVLEMAQAGADQLQEKTSSKTRYELAKGLLPMIDLALDEDNFVAANKLLVPALSSARKSKNPALVKQLTERQADVKERTKLEDEIKAARETLAKDSDDPAANLTMGKYYCLLKNDWRRGLPLLARSGNTAMKNLAEQEIANPATADAQVKLADGWYALGEAASGHEKEKCLAHAEQWYRKALPEVSGLMQIKVKKRLEELDGAAAK